LESARNSYVSWLGKGAVHNLHAYTSLCRPGKPPKFDLHRHEFVALHISARGRRWRFFDCLRQAWQHFFELQSEPQRDRFSGWGRYERRRGKRRVYRNGYYERDFVTRFGTIRLRIARTREKSFLPVGLRRFQRRAEEVSLLIREAFLRGISTRQVGRVVATITGETVSAQTVSKLTRDWMRRCGSFIRRSWVTTMFIFSWTG